MIRFLAFVILAQPAIADPLRFPGNAEMLAEETLGLARYELPTGPWDGQIPAVPIEGAMVQQAWRIDAAGLSTLQLLRPLREQLLNDGFEVVFECETRLCGGFDFRFGTLTLPPPALQINLADFRFLSAWKGSDDGDIGVSLFVSQTGSAGFVQVTQVGATVENIADVGGAPARADTPTPGTGIPIADALNTLGYAVLDGLFFETGSSQLAEAEFAALQALSDYLASNPNLKVALVGHTDAEGSLDGNIALSKRRAGSVLERLVTDYNVARSQLDAQGMGYLSPIANNLTQEGRDANRRVEVIVTSTGE